MKLATKDIPHLYAGSSETLHLQGGYSATIELQHDSGHGAPWEECDGHGIVSDFETRKKRPGELVLHELRSTTRFYDFAASVKIARRDGWGSKNCAPEMTNGQKLHGRCRYQSKAQGIR